MGKIGICACYDTQNYGSMLQAFSTEYVISNLGLECEFIRYKKKKTPVFLLKQIIRVFNRNLISDKVMVIKKKILLSVHPNEKEFDRLRKDKFYNFQKKYYKNFSEVYYGYGNLKEGAKKYDTVCVGSDQLWTPGGLSTNFYNLMFVPDGINKVSYATSFGVSKIPSYQIKATKKFLNRIDYLSVREQSGREIVKQTTGRDAKVVLDPTLLLTKQEWDNLIEARNLVDEPYIFCYFLGDNLEHRKLAKKIAIEHKLKIVTTPYLDNFVKEDITFGDHQICAGPDDFINLIRNAEYVITDSFHGTVFSILYHKKFIIFERFKEGSQSRNTRIESLLNLLDLQDRRYSTDDYDIDSDIDYKKVEERLSTARMESIQFLRSSLL